MRDGHSPSLGPAGEGSRLGARAHGVNATPRPEPRLIARYQTDRRTQADRRRDDYMRTALMLLAGAAPGVAVAYLVLLGYLLNRVRPIPIALPLASGASPVESAERPDETPAGVGSG